MKIYEMRNDEGLDTGFEVSNLLLSRNRTCQIVRSIPGAKVLREPKSWSWRSEDAFLEFELGGERFLAIEPFGDNSRYWIVKEPPSQSMHLAAVKQAFRKASKLSFITNDEVGKSVA